MSVTRLTGPRRISSSSVSATTGTYGLHPDARDWRDRVVANGGSVSASTLNAVSVFCAAAASGGWRDRFLRLNLFCGTSDSSLFAVRTPLFRGQSLGGTQFGNAMDTNNNFVAGDYTETGSSGGLSSNATKWLNTGLATNALTVGDRHLSAYEVVRSGGTYQRFLGSEGAGAGSQQFLLGYDVSGGVVRFGFGAFSATLSGASTSTGGHFLGNNMSDRSGSIYKNASRDAFTNEGTTATPTTAEVYVFGINRGGSATDGYAGRLGGYSIGLSMTPTQVSSFYSAMQSFQTALTRNV